MMFSIFQRRVKRSYREAVLLPIIHIICRCLAQINLWWGCAGMLSSFLPIIHIIICRCLAQTNLLWWGCILFSVAPFAGSGLSPCSAGPEDASSLLSPLVHSSSDAILPGRFLRPFRFSWHFSLASCSIISSSVPLLEAFTCWALLC